MFLNAVDITVIIIVLLLFLPILIYLILTRTKNPCSGCSHVKGGCTKCNAFSKKNIKKAYKKAIKKEEKTSKGQ